MAWARVTQTLLPPCLTTLARAQACAHGGGSGPGETWWPSHAGGQAATTLCFSGSACITFVNLSHWPEQVAYPSPASEREGQQSAWLQAGL